MSASNSAMLMLLSKSSQQQSAGIATKYCIMQSLSILVRLALCGHIKTAQQRTIAAMVIGTWPLMGVLLRLVQRGGVGRAAVPLSPLLAV